MLKRNLSCFQKSHIRENDNFKVNQGESGVQAEDVREILTHEIGIAKKDNGSDESCIGTDEIVMKESTEGKDLEVSLFDIIVVFVRLELTKMKFILVLDQSL